MITSEYDERKLGSIEIFKDNDIKVTKECIWIRMKSFSSVSVSYWEK